MSLSPKTRYELIRVQTMCEYEAQNRRDQRDKALAQGDVTEAQQLDAEAEALLDAAEVMLWLRQPEQTPPMASAPPSGRGEACLALAPPASPSGEARLAPTGLPQGPSP